MVTAPTREGAATCDKTGLLFPRPDTPRPVTLTWKNSATARERLGERFEAIVRILRNAEAEDRAKPPEKRFVLVLA